MIAVLAAALLCLAFHLSTEGTTETHFSFGNMLGLRLGRFAFGVVAFRPGRLYYRVQWRRK